jgi:NitT/TauT family transport system ATP-binding protein
MPTIAPIPKPKMMIAGSTECRAALLIDFPDSFGQEREVRQDSKVKIEAMDFAAGHRSPAGGGGPGVAASIRNLRHAYGELQTIARLDLEIPPGGVVGLVGPSGCGKSTLLELACGLQRPVGGEIDVGGATDAPGRLARCAFMPQRDLLLPWLEALDNAALALRNRGAGRAVARAEAARLFERFGLAGFERARPDELSGGMRQRVAFLRTLLSGKPLLALDEPFASLDAITRAEMQAWLAAALDSDPRTVLLVTHDVEEALYLSDRVAVLSSRPARVLAQLQAPDPRAPDRDGAVTDPGFVAVRERAMQALRAAARPTP